MRRDRQGPTRQQGAAVAAAAPDEPHPNKRPRQRASVRSVQTRNQVIQSAVHLACLEAVLSVFESGQQFEESEKQNRALAAYKHQVEQVMQQEGIFSHFDFRDVVRDDGFKDVRVLSVCLSVFLSARLPVCRVCSIIIAVCVIRKCYAGKTKAV